MVLLCVGGVLGSEMRIDFPLFMRAPVPAAASSTNLNTFTGAIGGIAADPITSTGNSKDPFEVDGSTFADFQSALNRSCNNQHNACASAANASGDKSLTVGDCDNQQTQCMATTQGNSSSGGGGGGSGSGGSSANGVTSVVTGSSSTSATSAQATFRSADANFFYFCDP